MLKPRIIPCLDVRGGRVVKGINFVDLVDAGDPVEQAGVYDSQGADELCFLDITASHEGREPLLDVVSGTAEQCFMPLTVGGGIRTLDDIRALLLAGADKVSINTAAVHRPEFVSEAAHKFGSQCIVVAVDAKRGEAGRYEIFTHGGREATGIEAISWCRRMAELGAGEILLTSMDRDGTREGVRYRTHAIRRRLGARTGRRQRWRGNARAFGRGYPVGSRDGSLGCFYLPLRYIQHSASESLRRQGRHSRSAITCRRSACVAAMTRPLRSDTQTHSVAEATTAER